MNAKNIVLLCAICFIVGAGGTGGIVYKLYLDAERASSAIIGQLRSEQQRSADINQSITDGITDTISKLGKAQGLSEKNRLLFGALRKIINALPDYK